MVLSWAGWRYNIVKSNICVRPDLPFHLISFRPDHLFHLLCFRPNHLSYLLYFSFLSGLITFFISFVGCCGSCNENSCMVMQQHCNIKTISITPQHQSTNAFENSCMVTQPIQVYAYPGVRLVVKISTTSQHESIFCPSKFQSRCTPILPFFFLSFLLSLVPASQLW